MKKLIDQILKFGVVGIISFIVDFVITMAVSTGLRQGAGMGTSQAALIGAFFGFVVSVIVNYILSMKYVFERRDDLDRKKEFIIFVVLSVFGLGINELIILFCIDIVYATGHGFMHWLVLPLQQRALRSWQRQLLWSTIS
ncbi:GtrA family protein [Roseburia sp. AM51-8]|uniref:GtrA family protein n=1 Tax=Roseburia sp. AM51-8 TaxID=2292366 RepID=UPI0018F386AA|nr:GtrA family protein [Roseburia sp. AM51-8]